MDAGFQDITVHDRTHVLVQTLDAELKRIRSSAKKFVHVRCSTRVGCLFVGLGGFPPPSPQPAHPLVSVLDLPRSFPWMSTRNWSQRGRTV
jgi:hypothetical protein